jgi:4-hydroxy-3-methylbut-2-en-1-yl diphosphate reductase
MKVVVPRHSGFCPGVQQAEGRLMELAGNRPERSVFILGQLIHNAIYIDHLKRRGIRTIEDPAEAPEGSTIVIRTHGIPRELEERLRALKGREVVDLTCYKVKQVQEIIKSHSESGWFTVLNGKKIHPEVQGLVSYASDSIVVESRDDLESLIAASESSRDFFKSRGYEKVFVLSQTTGDEALFAELVRRLAPLCAGAGYEFKSHNSICSITSLRENEALSLQKETDVTFVIGDKQSSNARKLFNRLDERKEHAVYFIENPAELSSYDLSRWKSAQVVSSSSTPSFTEKAVVDFLKD